MSVSKHLRCRYCRSPKVKTVRGRYGKPVLVKYGVLRLLVCHACGKHNLVATLVVNSRNARDISDIIGAT